MVIFIIHFEGMALFEDKGNAPIAGNLHGPSAHLPTCPPAWVIIDVDLNPDKPYLESPWPGSGDLRCPPACSHVWVEFPSCCHRKRNLPALKERKILA
jgi:hypothetical protein